MDVLLLNQPLLQLNCLAGISQGRTVAKGCYQSPNKGAWARSWGKCPQKQHIISKNIQHPKRCQEVWAGICLDSLCGGKPGEKPLDHNHVSVIVAIKMQVSQRTCSRATLSFFNLIINIKYCVLPGPRHTHTGNWGAAAFQSAPKSRLPICTNNGPNVCPKYTGITLCGPAPGLCLKKKSIC